MKLMRAMRRHQNRRNLKRQGHGTLKFDYSGRQNIYTYLIYEGTVFRQQTNRSKVS